MRDALLFYINGEPHRVSGEAAFAPLTDYLRYGLAKTGTKVVCAEGDCGACTVLVGRICGDELMYKPLNACIQYLYQLDCTHIVTIEGLKTEGQLNAVQTAMMNCHGAQCGYCTPGIVVAMCGMFHEKACANDLKPATRTDVRNALTGNLCRCTGYDAILQAGEAVKPAEFPALPKLYPSKEMISEFKKHQSQSVEIHSEDRTAFIPASIKEATTFKSKHPDAVWITGGTDVSVFCNKRDFEPPEIISLSNLPDLSEIKVEQDHLVVGGKATLTQLEEAVQMYYPELHKMLEYFGSPQIKHAGTLAGNIANGSPIGDTLPFLYVLNAEVEFTGASGARRVNINNVFLGYRKLDIKSDELITRVFIPLLKKNETLKLYKISKRKHLDISTLMAAIVMRKNGHKIEDIRIAYGGVGPMILRLTKTEAFLVKEGFHEESFCKAGELALSEITPIGDVRGSKDYRLQLARNILQKFYLETAEPARKDMLV